MKRVLYILGMGLMMAACDLERSDNGDLDGMWQLRSVDSLNGRSADMRVPCISWSFQGDILETRKTPGNGVKDDIIFRFSHHGDSLKLMSPFFNDRDNGDVEVEDVDDLCRFGINELEEGFKVLQLSSGSMSLQSESLRLHFRKY